MKRQQGTRMKRGLKEIRINMEMMNWEYIDYHSRNKRNRSNEFYRSNRQNGGNIGKIIWLLFFFFAVILNIIAWLSSAFCDFYIKTVFPIWGRTYGWLCSLVPFSIGEKMLCIAVILLVCLVIFAVAWLIGGLIFRIAWINTLFRIYGSILAWIFLVVVWVMTLNCTIPYHASSFEQKYMKTTVDKEYSVEDLTKLRNYVVGQMNLLAPQMKRDAENYIIYDGDISEQAIKEVKRLGKSYDQLGGYYPRSKPISFSGFMSQMHMAGYYFPFSMETNYNDLMYVANKPYTICHELAHFKGFMYEDDAGLIGYLACITSKEPFFQYCGYLNVYNYIERDFRDSVPEKKYNESIQIDELVKRDNIFLTEAAWDQVDESAIFRTEIVDKWTDVFTDTSLKLNGVKIGTEVYHKVVDLLLKYYDGKLEGEQSGQG